MMMPSCCTGNFCFYFFFFGVFAVLLRVRRRVCDHPRPLLAKTQTTVNPELREIL